MSSKAPTTVGTTRGVRVGRALIVIGGALVALSSWLNWGAKTQELGRSRTAYTIPAKFVIDNSAGPGSPGLSLGIVVLVLGLLVVASAFAPAWRIAGLVLGVAAAVTAILYVYQVREVVHDANLGKSVRDFISIGPYIAVIGGILAAVGGVVALIPPGFWSSLTSEETPEEDEGKPAGAGGAP
jgi:hypothetical protein